jgi:hypothetical protein
VPARLEEPYRLDTLGPGCEAITQGSAIPFIGMGVRTAGPLSPASLIRAFNVPPPVRETADQVTALDMRPACAHASHMSRMVQIRNVPDALHRKLKSRAADAGQTLSDYLLAELERTAARPTRDDMLKRIHGRRRVTLKTPAATIIREERESA